MLINKTKKSILSKDYKICKTFLSKTIGLMLSFKPKTLLFVWEKEEIRDIHMFFVFFPIDILWLDKEKRVIAIRKRVMPFSFVKINKPAQYVIESAQGMVIKTRTETQDLIRF